MRWRSALAPTRRSKLFGLSQGILQAICSRRSEDRVAFFSAVSIYYGDVVLMEPALLTQYDELLPQIDRALHEPSATASSGR